MDPRDTPTISHPEKILFPQDGITKGELAAYYDAIAPLMLPHLHRRPVTMERFPSGIGQKGFLQKDVSKGFPDWLERVEAPKRGGAVHYPLIEDRRALAWLANQNCITPHVWTSRAPHLYQPDLCVFDLDPSEDEPAVLRRAALAVRDVLAEAGLQAWVKTSGSKGFHIVVPLDGEADFEVVMALVDAVGRRLAEREPESLTNEFLKADRRGRIFVDIAANQYSATFACAYAVRARTGAPVSAPCTWEEVADGRVAPATFNLRSMVNRVAEVGDLWADLYREPQSAAQALARLGGAPEGPSPAWRRFR
jgi:bifunctional non-homologous end joining protein LigD